MLTNFLTTTFQYSSSLRRSVGRRKHLKWVELQTLKSAKTNNSPPCLKTNRWQFFRSLLKLSLRDDTIHGFFFCFFSPEKRTSLLRPLFFFLFKGCWWNFESEGVYIIPHITVMKDELGGRVVHLHYLLWYWDVYLKNKHCIHFLIVIYRRDSVVIHYTFIYILQFNTGVIKTKDSPILGMVIKKRL